MTVCAVQETGTIELYFYGELQQSESAAVEEHLRRCRECKNALDELRMIRTALAARPDVSAPASGDWSAFMDRLDGAVQTESATPVVVVPLQGRPGVPQRPFMGLLATAALITIVSISVFFASQAGRRAAGSDPARVIPEIAAGGADDGTLSESGMASVGARHLERSKLVVLGLAAKEPDAGKASDWAYERELASALLNDTRLYRITAEQRGLTSLAGVMRDLELVLLQTSMADGQGESELPQIQRLIRKRGLVEKMDVVGVVRTTGLVP